jgi:Acyclic terpene utilisation family protein AtuA
VKTIRIGCGAGYSGDRIEPALELAEHGELDYLVFECLAERTIALAQLARARDPAAGYDPLLLARMQAVLPACVARGVRIITNMGAANPLAAAAAVRGLAASLGLTGLNVAAITGDDVLDVVRSGGFTILETGEAVASLGRSLVSANAYLGAEPIVAALAGGADVIVAGRIADPSMFVAAAMHELGWAADAWPLLGCGTVAGHLLECAGQVTGGYFADPSFKDVDDLARLGFPIAEISEDGGVVITKVPGSGGRVTVATCTEQLLYEIHDPAVYTTPDTIADFSGVRLTEIAPDRVRVEGARGRSRTGTLKASLGYNDGFIGEGQISYAGSGAAARAELARAIVEERLRLAGVRLDQLRCDFIGIDALHRSRLAAARGEPYEVRLRVAGWTKTMADAIRVGNEVEALYTNGPAGGAGVVKSAREVLAIASTLIPRDLVTWHVNTEAV